MKSALIQRILLAFGLNSHLNQSSSFDAFTAGWSLKMFTSQRRVTKRRNLDPVSVQGPLKDPNT